MINMVEVNDVVDYIILKTKVEDEESFLSNLKLQKLLYYSQAWYLAFNSKTLFNAKFQAWVHGPVCPIIFDRFKATKSIYSEITTDDVLKRDLNGCLSEFERQHIDSILEHYGRFSGADLEYISHREEPWIRARGSHAPFEKCNVEIDEALMTSFYKQRLSNGQNS